MTADEIITGNEGLVQSIANTLYRHNSVYSVADLAQVGFLALCKSAHKYDPARAAVTTFITHCARNDMVKYIQRNARVVSHIERPNLEDTSSDISSLEEESLEIEEGINALDITDLQRKILNMRVDGRSYKEISAATGFSIGKVRKIARQIKKKAREVYA